MSPFADELFSVLLEKSGSPMDLARLSMKMTPAAAAKLKSGIRAVPSTAVSSAAKKMPRAPNVGYKPAPSMAGVNPTLMANQQVQGAFDALPAHVKQSINSSDLVRAGMPAPMAYNLAYMSRGQGETGIASALRHSVGGGGQVRSVARQAQDAATKVGHITLSAFYEELRNIMEAA